MKPINSFEQDSFIVAAYTTYWGRTKDTLTYFKSMKDANVNLVIPCDEQNEDEELSVFNDLETVGLPFLAASKSVFCEKKIETEENFLAFFSKFRDFSSFYGFYVWDEPREDKYELIKHNEEIMKKYAPKRATYICQLPSYGTAYWEREETRNDAYRRTVDGFCNVVKPCILSNDYYPFYDENTELFVHDLWADMGFFRKKSILLGIPYWHVFQGLCDLTVGHYGFLTPAHISVQIFSAITHGAAGVLYFLNNIMVDRAGVKSPYYDEIAALNKRVQQIGNILLNKESVGIYHGGLDKEKTAEYSADSVETSDVLISIPEKSLVGVFVNGGNSYYIAISNKDYKNALSGELLLRFDFKLSVVSASVDGKAEYDDRKISLKIPKGDMLLLKVDK